MGSRGALDFRDIHFIAGTLPRSNGQRANVKKGGRSRPALALAGEAMPDRRFGRLAPLKTLYWSKRLIGVSPGESGLDFFAGGPE